MKVKPQKFKDGCFDLIVKAINIAQKQPEYHDYFEQIGLEFLGIEGRGIKNDKREGLVFSLKDLTTNEIKHIEINPTVKMTLYEEFAEYFDYATQVQVYEQSTGNKVEQKGKNKVTHNFETLAENVKGKISDVNELASQVFD